MALKPIYSLIIIGILFINSSKLIAQEIQIYGSVKSDSNTPIDNANVVISNNKSILAYSYTDSIGAFNFKLKSTKEPFLILSVYSLGYKNISDTIQVSSNSQIHKLSFTLSENLEQLDEVVIASDAKIKREDNKFVYSVNAFKDNTEQTVEDILKKLPGIEVLDNGLIKAHGRFIDKLLIEGEDMFDKNYSILSKNLDAKVLKEVEILEGFEDNPVLAKVLASNKVAVNLVLKEEYNNIWFGNISTGLGSKERFNLASNVGLIRKKIKFFNFNNFNNLGSLARNQINIAQEENTTYSNFNELKIDPIYETPDYQIQFFNNNEAIFNSAFINSLSFVKSVNSKLKVRGTGYYLKDNEDFLSTSETIFNTTNPSITYNESRRIESKNPLVGGNIELKYFIDEQSFIKNTLNFKNTDNLTNQNLLFNDTPINENLKTSQASFFNHLNYTVLINKKLIHNYFYFGRINSDQQLNLISPTLNMVFIQPEFKPIKNTTNDESQIIGSKSSLLINMGKIENTLELGIENLHEKRKNIFKLTDQTEIDTLQNNLKHKQDKLFFTSNLRYKPSKKIELYGSLSFEYVKIDNYLDENNHIFLNPKIGLRLKNLKIGNLNFQFHRDYIAPATKVFLENFQLRNYQSFIRGDTSFSFTKRNKYKFSYYISNELQTQTLSITTQFIEADGRYTSSNFLNQDFSFSTLKFEKGGDILISKIDITSYFKKLKLSTNLGVLWNTTNTPIKLNSVNFSNLNLVNSSYFLTGRTYFNSDINFNFKLNLNETKSTLNSVTSITNWKTIAIDVNYNLNNELTALLKNKFYLLQYGNYSFINFELNFSPEKSKFSYRLIFNNLNNENELIMENINEVSTYTSEIRLLPRYLFLEAKYRF
ncbi:carboxypeptidase-like regulatory domain-containing protein [Bizionia sediminis]|uniref:Carboxypeptidase-like regulatory domain-containing protein n=1 Tax=Bizionia sediminis TaxID=1737064 RepID=A0ABW5KTP7_9FLAO